MGLLLQKTMIVLAIICIPLLSAPTSESAIPPPPIPYSYSQPLSPNGFLVAEHIYQQDWTRGTYYLFTMLNGTSASFDLEFKPSEECKNGCRGWEFPLNIQLKLLFQRLDNLSMTDWGGKHRQLSGQGAAIGDVDIGATDTISVLISPNPIVLKLGETVKVKVTITTKANVEYGLYEVGLGAVGWSWPFFFLKTTNVRVGLDTRYENVLGLLKDYSPEQIKNIEAQYTNFRGSGRFANSSWFALKDNGALKLSYDGQTVRDGWWEIKKNQIVLILPDGSFTGGKGRLSDVVLYDGSVWRWTGLTGGFPKPVVVEAWRHSEQFSPVGFCSVEKGWVGNYPNVTTYTLTRGTSVSLKFTAMPTRNFSFPLNLNLSLRQPTLENGTTIRDDIKGVKASFSPNPLILQIGAQENFTVIFTASKDAPEGLYGIEFDSANSPLTPQGYVKLLYEGHRPVGQGTPVSFFLKVQSSCQESRNGLPLYAVAASGIALALGFALLYIRRRKRQ